MINRTLLRRASMVLAGLLPSILSAQAIPEWRLSEKPVVVLGGPEGKGPAEFSTVYTGAFWAGGLIVVDGNTQTLRHFAMPSGAHLRTFGGKGKGPGEFLGATWLEPLTGDSLFVSDNQQNRYTIYDSMARQVTTVSTVALDAWEQLTPIGRLDDGTVLAWASRLRSITTDGVQPLKSTIYRISPDGRHADSMRTLPFTTVNSAPFQKGRGFRVVLGAGQMIPAFGGGYAYLNSPTTFTINRFTPAQGWSTIQRDVPVRLGTAATGDRLRATAVAQGASESYMATVPVVDTLPAIHMVLASESGTLFAVEGAADSAQHRRGISAFSRSGAALGRFYIPTRLFPIAISDSLIALTEYDPEDAPSVTVHKLIR